MAKTNLIVIYDIVEDYYLLIITTIVEPFENLVAYNKH